MFKVPVLAQKVGLFLLNLKLCLIEINSNRRRTFITSFGIFLGMASLLILLSFMRSMQKMVSEELVRMGGLSVASVQKIDPQDSEEAIQFQRSPGLKLEQMELLQQTIPEIDQILPKKDTGAMIGSGGRESRCHVVALTPAHFPAFNYELESGRFLTDQDNLEAAAVCMLGARVSDQLFKGEDPVGKTVLFRNKTFKVVGFIKTEDQWDWRARMMLYPFSVYEKYFAAPGATLPEIQFSVKDVSKLEATREAIIQGLITLHRGVKDIDIVLNETRIEEQKNTNSALSTLLVVLAGLSLLIGGIGITNIMFATIGDRIREIGLRKALGARPSDLLIQFLIEAVLLTTVGAIPGILAGSIPMLFLNDVLPIEPTLTAIDYSIALGFTLTTGIMAGLFPALKAARMNPVEALSHA